MYLSLLLEKKLLHLSMPPSMNCFQTSYAQIHLTERKKTPCTLWPTYFKDFLMLKMRASIDKPYN